MDNTTPEKLPIGTEGAEALVVQPEVRPEVGAIEVSSDTPPTAVSTQSETILKPDEKSVGTVIGDTKTPEPSAGFKIKPGTTGASAIVLKKLIGAIIEL